MRKPIEEAAERRSERPPGLWHTFQQMALILAVVAAGAVRSEAKPDIAKLEPGPIAVTASPITHFGLFDASRNRFGKLIWRGGLVLSSSSAFLGGLSGLAIDGRGERFLAVSDAGFWLAGSLLYDGSRLSGVTATRIGPLRALQNRDLARNADRDAEGIALVQGSLSSGTVLIAFEQNRRIGRFPVKDGMPAAPLSYVTLPAAARKLTGNRSLESVAFIAGGPAKGSIVIFAERKTDGEGHRMGWLIGPDRTIDLALADIGDFDISDAAATPAGDVIVLERRFRWSEGVKMRLRRVTARELLSRKPIAGEILFEADQAFAIDNMEGLAIHRDSGGATVLTLVSDDNFSFLQRTLIVQFAIAEGEITQ
jgi:hypothetical protein